MSSRDSKTVPNPFLLIPALSCNNSNETQLGVLTCSGIIFILILACDIQVWTLWKSLHIVMAVSAFNLAKTVSLKMTQWAKNSHLINAKGLRGYKLPYPMLLWFGHGNDLRICIWINFKETCILITLNSVIIIHVILKCTYYTH